ncbi:MAG TPA: hypothetical protein VKV25_07420, partial [Acidimicrobiales bacterium]|nr:hypothetical protein [Acidimicrobiales bacterium]
FPAVGCGHPHGTMAAVEIREDCRHYLARTIASGEVVRRCRLGAAAAGPFECPEGCLFFEPRAVMGAGWAQAPSTPMSNTADGLAHLPAPRRRRRRR